MLLLSPTSAPGAPPPLVSHLHSRVPLPLIGFPLPVGSTLPSARGPLRAFHTLSKPMAMRMCWLTALHRKKEGLTRGNGSKTVTLEPFLDSLV